MMNPITSKAQDRAGASQASSKGKSRHKRESSITTLSDDYVASFFSGPEDNVMYQGDSAPDKMKSAWIGKQLKQREGEYTEKSDIRIIAGTFNVNGRKPKNEADEAIDLDDWLVNGVDGVPDVYAIGFQELDLSKENFLLNNSSYEDMWTPAIEMSLRKKGEYTKLVSKQLVGMLLVIFVHSKHVGHISDVATASEGTGIMGLMGNKGGVSIRFKFHASTFCFVCSHLAAHTKNVLRRNHDWSEIMTRTVLVAPESKEEFHILDHDTVIAVGDFNYRIPDRDPFEVIDLIKRDKYEALLTSEQLYIEKNSGNVFVGFDEAPIQFAPTYKYEPGTDNFELKKLRTPAWCDRVLFRGDVTPVQYTSCPQLKLSDHKPVRLLMTCGVQLIDPTQYGEVLQSVHRSLDTLENEAMPDATISNNVFDLGEMHFGEYWRDHFTITNTGKVILSWQFTNKPDEDRYASEWLTMDPACGMMSPGESMTVRVVCQVDETTAADLNDNTSQLDDIVVLHLANGKDFFISVSGTWRRSCMCTPLAVLADTVVPVGSIAPSEGVLSGTPGSGETRLRVPKELWRMVDHIQKHGREEDDLFFAGPSLENLQRVIGFVDTDTAIPQGFDVHAVAEAILMFLRCLPEAVIPSEFYKQCMDSRAAYATSRQVINRLAPANQYVFLYVTALLRELLNSTQPDEHVSPEDALQLKDDLREKYALLFGTILMRPPETGKGKRRKRLTPALTKKQGQFIEHFLSNPDIAD